MRFTTNYHGQVRYIKRFALFPIKVDNEIRWLETCYLRQTWHESYCAWLNNEFVTEGVYKSVNNL